MINIFELTLEIIAFVLAVYLAYLSNKVYRKTCLPFFRYFSVIIVLLIIVEMTRWILRFFVNGFLDSIPFHQTLIIIFLVLMILIFKPQWHFKPGGRNEKVERRNGE